MEQPRFVHALCRRRCCPVATIDPAPAAKWAAILVETGGGERAPAELRLTRDEVIELARALDRAGFVAIARGTAGG